MREIKPIWTTASFLVYLGGLTVLLGGIYALVYLYIEFHGGGARTAWALLILVVLLFVAGSLRLAERWLAAGIFAFTAVIAWGLFVGSAWAWFGWLSHWSSPFQGWSLAHLSLEFLILVVALAFRRIWRFPFIGLISALLGWFFVTDFISNGGTWTYIVSFFIGLLYLVAGTVIDQPSAFWLHFAGGLLIGVPIYHWFNKSDFDFAIILIVSVLFVLIAYGTKRSKLGRVRRVRLLRRDHPLRRRIAGNGRRRSSRSQRRARVHEHADRTDLQVDRAVLARPLGARARVRPPRLLARLPRPARAAAARGRPTGTRRADAGISLVTIEAWSSSSGSASSPCRGTSGSMPPCFGGSAPSR